MFDYYKGPKSNHFNGKEFLNPGKPLQLPKSPFKWMLNRQRGVWPKEVIHPPQPKPPTKVEGDKLRVTFINHATVLIQTQGLNFLTDPIWSKRAGPKEWFGIKRVHDPGLAFKYLPPIDWVLISHNHYDHLDLPTLKKLQKVHQPQVAVGLGTDVFLRKKIPSLKVHAMDWQEEKQVEAGLKIHFVPVQHWSARHLWDRNKMLWGGFVIQTLGGNIYFGGDTGYGPHFKKTGEKYGPFRLALLPIGDYKPRWIMEENHMDVQEAIWAMQDLRAKQALGIHHGTFQLADTGYEEVFKELEKQRRDHQIASESFRFLQPGEGWKVDYKEGCY